MNPRLSQDAAIVLALGATSLPHARSAHSAAERWVRILRLYGEVGIAMQAVGVGEAPLETAAEPKENGWRGLRDDIVELVTDRAQHLARQHDSQTVCTVDLLFALFEIYGNVFDRALYVRGTSREELVERITERVTA